MKSLQMKSRRLPADATREPFNFPEVDWAELENRRTPASR